MCIRVSFVHFSPLPNNFLAFSTRNFFSFRFLRSSQFFYFFIEMISNGINYRIRDKIKRQINQLGGINYLWIRLNLIISIRIEMLKNIHGYVFIFILVDSTDLKSD